MKHVMKAALVAIAVAFAASASAQTFVRMVSGPAGGSWYPFGAKIADFLQKDISGISTQNRPGGGTGNVRTVDKGSAELGWTFGFTAYNGFNGKGKFKKEHKNVRFFATLYPGVLQTAVPAKSKIMSYKDLADKNISPGKITFSGNVTMEKLLGLYGITYAQIKKNGGAIHRVGYTDSVALMKDGHIDAFVGLTTAPNSSFLALDFQPGIRFLPVEAGIADTFIKQNPGFFKMDIDGGLYKGTPDAVPTIATATVLIINKSVPNALAYKLVDSLWRNHGALVKVHGNWKNVKLADALKAAAIPVHPGVAKYYKEKGL